MLWNEGRRESGSCCRVWLSESVSNSVVVEDGFSVSESSFCCAWLARVIVRASRIEREVFIG